jgi:methyl-accepting chemotaxis protein
MRHLRNLRISHQLVILTVVMLGILAASVVVGLRTLRTAMLEDRQEQIIRLVQVAEQIVETWQAREKAGELSREEAQNGALEQLRVIRFGAAKDYFFVQRYDGVTLLNPNRELEGKNRLAVADSTGNPYVRGLIDAAMRGGGQVPYRFPRPGGTTPLPKLSYSVGFAPWQWAICQGTRTSNLLDRRFPLARLELDRFYPAAFEIRSGRHPWKSLGHVGKAWKTHEPATPLCTTCTIS